MISVLAATFAILALGMFGAYQFTPFEVGQVKAHLLHEMNPADIARIVLKPDGKTHYSVTTIHNIIDKLNNVVEEQSVSGRRELCGSRNVAQAKLPWARE